MPENFMRRVLVLDDDPFMLRLLARLLQNLGFTEVSTVDNGGGALELVDNPQRVPALILLDLNMPGMDGIEFVRRLVEHHYEGALILVSGEDERMLQSVEKLAKTHRLQVLGHLLKPPSPERMMALLEKWVSLPQEKSSAAKRIYDGDDVRTAITNGELVNYYQPKVSLASGQVEGVETLVRWRHPQHGLVFPDQFIGVSESHGLIDGLTRTVLNNALTQARQWQDAGMPLKVAINVSMENLLSLDFADYVSSCVAEAGVPPHSVVLEVTESRLMRDARTPLEILTRLRMKRFHLSIDDFGTGNSTLMQLRDIPFSELKIDQGFVHGAGSNNTLRAMFDASLGLARQLEMKSVAEGVEDRADWDFLRQTECDLVQGYFIAKPMPAADLPAWIETWQSRLDGESLL